MADNNTQNKYIISTICRHRDAIHLFVASCLIFPLLLAFVTATRNPDLVPDNFFENINGGFIIYVIFVMFLLPVALFVVGPRMPKRNKKESFIYWVYIILSAMPAIMMLSTGNILGTILIYGQIMLCSIPLIYLLNWVFDRFLKYHKIY